MGIVRAIAEDGLIRYGNYNADVRVLGPGKRFVIWLQGCEAECPGCVAPEFRPFDGGKLISVDLLAEKITAAEGIEGITISGGEPFLQADKLCLLLEKVKNICPDISVIIYSGFTYEQLKAAEDECVKRLLGCYIDVLIDGRYIEELNDDIGLRGSSNQRIIFITEKYQDHDNFLSERSRQGRFITEGNGGRLYMIGVPSKKTQKMRLMLEKIAKEIKT